MPAGGPRPPGFATRGVTEAIEPFQPAAVDYLVDRAAAAAAELEFFLRLDEPRPDGRPQSNGPVRRRLGRRDFGVGFRHGKEQTEMGVGVDVPSKVAIAPLFLPCWLGGEDQARSNHARLFASERENQIRGEEELAAPRAVAERQLALGVVEPL